MGIAGLDLSLMFERQFFVCSYGGCASWTIADFLGRYGTVHHIHSRQPPEFLSLPVSRKALNRWFGKGTKEHFSRSRRHRLEDTSNCTVIYLYAKPVYSIFSRRAFSRRHLKSIGVTGTNLRKLSKMSRSEYLDGGVDLIGYEQFFDNYVVAGVNRNYNIVAVNVQKLWESLENFFTDLKLPAGDLPSFPKERPREREEEIGRHLDYIYSSFNRRIDEMEPITVIPSMGEGDSSAVDQSHLKTVPERT